MERAQARFLKRMLRYDAATESFFWCSGKRYVQDAAAALQLTGRSHECTGVTLRDGDQKLDGNETGAFCSALWLWTGMRSCAPPRPWHRSCNLQRSRRWPSSSDWCGVCWCSLRPSGSTPRNVCRSTWCVRRQRLGRRRGSRTLDHSSDRDLRRSSRRRNHWSRCVTS